MARRRRSLLPFPVPASVAVLVLFEAPGCRGRRPGEGAGERPPRIAVIPMGTTHEFWKSVHAGALTAARELGVEIVWKGPLKEDDRNEQVQIVETLAGSGVDALVLSPLDDRALDAARGRGPPGRHPDGHLQLGPPGRGARRLRLDRQRPRRRPGRPGRRPAHRRPRPAHHGPGQGGVEGTTKREEGFLAALRAEFPGIEVVSENQYGGTSTETAYQTMENLLARFGAVDAVFTPNESTTFGCLRALQDHGLAGRAVHVGFDASEKLVEALARGEISGLVLQDPFAMG